MTSICLIRHGETDWNALGKLQGRTDIPLNKNGIQQVEECREFLKASRWDAIITSPLMRAKQTAEIINEDLHIPIVEMEEFIERSFGQAEGMTLQERLSVYPDKKYPLQEDRLSLNKRVMAGLDRVNKKYKNGKVLVVAHGAVINSILAIVSNGEIGSGKTKLSNACLSNIHYHKEKWEINDFNQVSHLSR
ncbi:histidine phosphatase family protein [Bacillus sp. CGMCC 1.16607]|uniref:histidine phosphatase family protein n=1 Tax=Bacillus sp. CGMCC 1.16607 TaxID=3351842 RepID=UPI003633D702